MTQDKRGIAVVDLNSSHEASYARVLELKAERKEEEIPLNDEYWKALRWHRLAYAKGTLK